jgi:hypothetical protein
MVFVLPNAFSTSALISTAWREDMTRKIEDGEEGPTGEVREEREVRGEGRGNGGEWGSD